MNLSIMAMQATIVAAALTLAPAHAEEARRFTLSAPPEVQDSGLLRYVLPRFALKTQRRADLVEVDADLAIVPLGAGDQPLMARAGQAYGLRDGRANPAASMFRDWLTSDVGRTTIEAFSPADGVPFTGLDQAEVAVEITFDGDPEQGRALAQVHCGRCHRVTPTGTGMTIGSTPSFMALRALEDWADRFMAFYALNPHPAFLQVDGISPPFAPDRPSPIVPVEITLEDAEAIQAYAATVPPADLGAPIRHQ